MPVVSSNAQNSPSQASAICEPCELPDVQAGFRKGRGTRDQIANICWMMEKAREVKKNIYFCFIDYAEAFVWITINWKIMKEMGIPDHQTCLLRNLYAGQEATVRGWCTGTTQRDGMGREEGSGWGTHVYLWWIHFDIWQN